MFLPFYNYRHLEGRDYWNWSFPMRSNPIWTLRVAQECMLGLPVSYTKDLELKISNPIPDSYKETFERELQKNNKFANTVIWC
jgi:hypothetical protein